MRLVDEDERGLVELGRALAAAVGRPKPWSHSVLSRFARGEAPVTKELADAISAVFRLPPPVFFARSYTEAVALQVTSERYDNAKPVSDDEVLGKIAELPRRASPRPAPSVRSGGKSRAAG